LQTNRSSRKLAVLFVLDRSDSVPPEQQAAALRFINQASEQMSANDSAGVVVFGSDALVEYLPRYGLKLGEITSVHARDYTDIGAALRLALAAMPADAQKRIVLVSDGNENLGDAVEEAIGAASAGVQVDAVPITYRYDREVLIERLDLPSEVKEGEPFELRNDALVRERAVGVLAGKTPLTVTERITEPGLHRYEAAIEASPDTLAENNRALGYTRVQGMPTVLIVEGDPRPGC
jgi:hypothetical protein